MQILWKNKNKHNHEFSIPIQDDTSDNTLVDYFTIMIGYHDKHVAELLA